jgi:hypothetical protein
MGKKKKIHRRAANVLSPIDKKGIKLATLLTEVGIGIAAAGSADEVRNGDFGLAGKKFADNILSVNTTAGRIMWTGIGLKLLGKFVPQARDLGIVGLR